jgi:hypothetical protein
MIVLFLSFCGILCGGVLFYVFGIHGSDWSSRGRDPLVGLVWYSPFPVFLLCFLSALGKFSAPTLRIVIFVVGIGVLPFMCFLIINHLIGAALGLVGFLVLWLFVCLKQLSSDTHADDAA